MCKHKDYAAFFKEEAKSSDDETLRADLAQLPTEPHDYYNSHACRLWDQIIRREARIRGLL